MVIIEYCNLTALGACPDGTDGDHATWDGIFVQGDPDEDHYESYDLIDGWDPYATTFVPGGVYRTDAGVQVHGRLQMRWCSVKDIYVEAGAGGSDDVSTPYVKENHFGNYAIRSTEGGILNIVDCDFSKVRMAILIDNYEQFSTPDPGSKYMNAFQIVDCDFTVTDFERASLSRYRYCIELHKAQKVTIEGCTFTSTDSELANSSRGEALYAYESSFVVQKSGNFRRSGDVVTGEGRVGCLLYGNEQSDLSSYPSNHPWKTNSPRKCIFTGFFRAIFSHGGQSVSPLHTFVVDDAEFKYNFFPIFFRDNSQVTIARCAFLFLETYMGFTTLSSSTNKIFPFSADANEVGTFDRSEIVAYRSRNTLITECSFTSDYNGVGSSSGITINILIPEQLGGIYDDTNKKYVYDLIYKCSFSPTVHDVDYGVWVGAKANHYVLINCNTFTHLKRGFVVSDHENVKSIFHYTDMTTGRNAPAKNTFTNCVCDFWFPTSYTGNALNYYYPTGGTYPSSCGTSGALVSISSSETPDCNIMDCQRFPMTHVNEVKEVLDFEVYPNPSFTGQFTLLYRAGRPDGTIRIFDNVGREVFKTNFTSERGNIQVDRPLTSGIYYIRLDAGEHHKEGQVIISN